MSKTFTKKITTKSKEVDEALTIMFTAYADQLTDLVTQIGANRGATLDPQITLSEDGKTIEVEAFIEDRGTVIAVDGESVQLVEYSDLQVGDRYVTFSKGSFWLFLKEKEQDTKVGHFRSMKESIENINSEVVNNAIAQLKEKQSSEVQEANVIEEVKSGK